MILSCNSCEKKFVVPDNAIGKDGRLVQCSACGNKWKQFPINLDKIDVVPSKKKIESKKPKKISKIVKKKTRRFGLDLYSPEYLAKKHGIRIDENKQGKSIKNKKVLKVNFGFYNSLIVSIVFIILILRLLYFFRDFIEFYLPSSEVYINYTFETLKNIKDIILNLF